jgi:hypothetical protein
MASSQLQTFLLQVMCLPTSIDPGEPFHAVVRWCLQRPRRFHITFDALDMNTKEHYGGIGACTRITRAWVGVHTRYANNMLD